MPLSHVHLRQHHARRLHRPTTFLKTLHLPGLQSNCHPSLSHPWLFRQEELRACPSVSAQIGSPCAFNSSDSNAHLSVTTGSTVPNGLAKSCTQADTLPVVAIHSHRHIELPSATSSGYRSEPQDSDLSPRSYRSHSIAEQTSFSTDRT
jgi:hypothetical protein